MKNQTGKISLNKLKVASFITSFEATAAETVKGGARENPTNSNESLCGGNCPDTNNQNTIAVCTGHLCDF